jgi:hypothetical protein
MSAAADRFKSPFSTPPAIGINGGLTYILAVKKT